MKCPRCQSSKVDASGICMTCGYEVSQWKKKLEQRLHAIRQKEEEIEQNLQSIIDAAVSRQPEYSPLPQSDSTPYMPQLEELAFLEPDNDEPVLDLFVALDDDTPDVSSAVNADYPAATEHIVNAADIPDIEDAVNDKSSADDEGVAGDNDIAFIDDIADDDTADDDITDDDIADDDTADDDIADDDIADDDIADDVAYIDNIADDDAIADISDINAIVDNETIAVDDDITDDGAVDDGGISAVSLNDGGSVVSDTMDITYPDDAGYFPKEAGIQDVSDDEVIADVYNDAEAGDSPYILNAIIPEGRLIFLSRTLSGLVDLFLTVLFTVVFLCASDFFTDAPMLNSVNAKSFSTLFLMNYFLYSIFFLGTNGQTIGMIMTDLRVVSMNKKPLLLSHVVRRCAAFLVSLFGLGIGLLTGVISRECLCMHDRLSKTRVVRYM